VRVIYWPDGEPGAGTSWERSGPIHGYAESGFRERNSQLLSLSEAAYTVGLRHIERDLDDPQTPKVRADHLCFVTMRGDEGSTAQIGLRTTAYGVLACSGAFRRLSPF